MNRKPRILVVDDEWSMRELLSNVLKLNGFDVLLAKDGEELRQLAFKENFDLLILDIMLGNENGTDIYSDLISNGFGREIPVVFISALAEDRPPVFPTPEKKFSLVGKPFDPASLVNNIKECLQACNP